MSDEDTRRWHEKARDSTKEFVKRTAKETLDTVFDANNAKLAILLIFGLFVFFFDAFWVNFSRGGVLMPFMYCAYGVIFYLTAFGTEHNPSAMGFVTKRTVLAILMPALFYWLAEFLRSPNVVGSVGHFVVELFGNLLFPYGILVLMYFATWPALLMREAGDRSGLMNLLNILIVMLIAFSVLTVIFDAVEDTPALQELGVQGVGETVSITELWSDTVSFVTGGISSAYSGITGAARNTFGNASTLRYAGTVENQQGRTLGVQISRLQATKPQFYFEQHEDKSLSLLDEQAVWFGEVEARTFAEDMEVDLNCVYRYDDGNYTVDARPQRITVYYTGEFTDTYPFDCTMPLQPLLDEFGEQGLVGGRFLTTADFSFQTWGYATLTFMDRQIITELRRENRRPADVLGIDPYVQALYTPGPVGLGMLDRQPLPIGIDLQNPDANFLPAFGVTLENRWYGQGEVTRLHRLVLQVPEPFRLDVDACAGASGDPRIRSSGDAVQRGYTHYVFEDIEFESDQQLKTVRCPMTVGDDWSSLLGADLSPRQFTLVATTEYDYRSEVYAPARIGVRRI